MMILDFVRYAFLTGLCFFFAVLVAFSLCSGD